MRLTQLPILKMFVKVVPGYEASLRARAKAGHLNVHRVFDIEAHAIAVERKGDLRQHFARLASGLPTTNKHIDVRR